MGFGSWRILINESGRSSNSLKPWDVHPAGSCRLRPAGRCGDVANAPKAPRCHPLFPQEPRSPGQARTHVISLPRAIALHRRHRRQYPVSASYRGDCH